MTTTAARSSAVESTTALVVLDGWGVGEASPHNAIHVAATPCWDRLWQRSPRTTLDASGGSVGLPPGQMGNSEVGHMTLGAGRVVHQDLTRIDNAVASGEFAANPVLRAAVDASAGATLHVLGLLSDGGVHSHDAHIAALLELAASQGARVRLHAFLDGRDTPPRSALAPLERIESRWPGVVASLCGRYYAMDRDARWERTERAFQLLREGAGAYRFDTPAMALRAAYERGESDEFVQPTTICRDGEAPAALRDGDAVVFMNFRADRARQLARALQAESFDAFARGPAPKFATFATLARYADDIDAPAAFEAEQPADTVGECWAAHGLTQLRIAETEKYAHVTYFFSGGREQPLAGEERVLVPSPKVATYDLCPAMSAVEVTDRLIAAIDAKRFDAVVCNYANTDMVGHTGDFDAAVQAVQAVDQCLGRLVDALRRNGAQCLITADHGNVEHMRDADDGAHTAHTCQPVPLVYVGERDVRLAVGGTLADVAPTLLQLMDLAQPAAMSGRSLLR